MSEEKMLTVKRSCFSSPSFREATFERLYQSYSLKQKRSGVECFLIAAILFDAYTLSSTTNIPLIIAMSTLLTANCCLLTWCRLDSVRPTTTHLAWILALVQVLTSMALRRSEVTPRDSLGWVMVFVYLIYVALPLRLRYCVLLSGAACVAFLAAVVGLSEDEMHVGFQHAANCVLLLTATAMGLISYFVNEKQQRRAFQETRQSLEVKLVIEEQSAEQERLLLSVLPEHVAVQMRQDLDSADSQFKKIYMSRHENVSILYADIVGFTAISSTYSAQELVKMLNELFARFDKLADKYHQLRIKILGDCYYCISGAPQERPDHAVLCVHMGLSMVKAIKYVQQTTNSPVDMRVGIHTGAVLAGVLGQRQWQFDVYSKDVELANKMESSGLAGRVHISATTLSFLNGEFEVEPAYGEKREESLRIAGLKTYFIGKVLKPLQPEREAQNGVRAPGGGGDEDSCVIPDFASDTKDEDADGSQLGTLRLRQNSEDFKNRLRKELLNRDGHRELTKSTNRLSLAFNEPDLEKAYRSHTEFLCSVSLQTFILVFFGTSLAQGIIIPRRLINILSVAGGLLSFMIVSVVSLAEIAPSRMLSSCKGCFVAPWTRPALSVVCVFILTAVNIVDTFSCVRASFTMDVYENCTAMAELAAEWSPDWGCLYPSYFSYFAALILISGALPSSLPYGPKTLLMAAVAAAHCAANVVLLGPALDCEESQKEFTSNFLKGKYTLSIFLMTATVALAFLARHMDKVSRVLFLWRIEVERQRECASDMRRRNEALVYNILPPHVAEHFLGNRRRQHDELYSQSYAEVGVLFASMPNFSDFYSEETVNNQGLECLRFLNEVISDFDALLEQPQFQDIIKIKTIGSTYMAASGLNPTRQVKPDDPITVRWSQLALLVEFALELKKALQSINEQSFNHFVLKLGINHGPITAGVIGARKPHYDIWGNTVNVASRMESTGKAGCIQVTEETCQILQCFGYEFEQRGLVAVKGKGQLMTYYLIGKSGTTASSGTPPSPPTVPVSPNNNNNMTSGMDSVAEEDEEEEKSDDKTDKTVIECRGDDTASDVFNDSEFGNSSQPLLVNGEEAEKKPVIVERKEKARSGLVENGIVLK